MRMIEYNKNELAKVSGKYGFVRDTFEKVLRLTEVLRFIFSDEILSQHLILKGGTAINLRLIVRQIPACRDDDLEKEKTNPCFYNMQIFANTIKQIEKALGRDVVSEYSAKT